MYKGMQCRMLEFVRVSVIVSKVHELEEYDVEHWNMKDVWRDTMRMLARYDYQSRSAFCFARENTGNFELL